MSTAACRWSAGRAGRTATSTLPPTSAAVLDPARRYRERMGGDAGDVDPRFGQRLNRLRADRGLSLRDLAGLVHHGKSYVHELETGRKCPPIDVAHRLDEALDAGGSLVALVAKPDLVGVVDADRVGFVTRNPRSVDPAAVDALGEILAHTRRLEDSIGAAPLISAVGTHLRMIESLADEARGEVREDVVDLTGQWSQFAGWLHAATGQAGKAAELYARTLEYATEAGNADLAATALSMRGHLAWLGRKAGPVVGLSAAAAREGASPGIRAMAEQQQARGHALAGQSEDVDRHLDRAAELMVEAAQHPDREPPWVYFYSTDYLTMQRGLAYRLLGRQEDAIRELSAGLAAIPEELRRSEFVASYLLHLAAAHHDAGNRDEALRVLEDVRVVGSVTGSERIAGAAVRMARRFGV
jgi:tetratricopeptide (TPR) repeat protein